MTTVPPPFWLILSMTVWMAFVESPFFAIFTVALRLANSGLWMPLTSNGAAMGSMTSGMYCGPALGFSIAHAIIDVQRANNIMTFFMCIICIT